MPQMLYRLGQEGAESVKSAIRSIGDEGEGVEARLAAAAARKASQIEAIEARLGQVRAEADRIQEKRAGLTTGGMAGLEAIEQQRRADALIAQQMREGAAQAAQLNAEYAQMEARARALAAAMDPAIAAQMRFDAEMGEARILIAAGVLTLDEYCDKLRLEQQLLNQSTSAHGRAGVSVGQLRAGTQQLSYNIGDVAQGLALGTPLLVIFAQQGGQVVQAISLMKGEAGGLIGFLGGPWGAALLGAIMIVGMLGSKLLDAGDAAKKKEAAAKELKQAIDSLHESTERQIDSERRQRAETLASANALLAKAKASRAAALAEYERRLSTAKATEAGALSGEPGAEGAALLLASRKADVTAAKKELDEYRKQVATQKDSIAGLAILDMQANVAESIDRTANATNRYKVAVDKLNDTFKRTGDRKAYEAAYGRLTNSYNAEVEAIKESEKGADKHALSLARNASAMEVNAAGALALARAYLVGGDAALQAEAARKGLTDATRRGIDGEAQVRRQLDIMIGDDLAAGAKSIAQLREETSARNNVIAMVRAGTVPMRDMNRALGDEAALRPLLKLQAVAHGEALVLLTTIIDAYRTALNDAHAVEGSMFALKGIDDARQRVIELKAAIADLSADPASQSINAARRAAELEADAQKLTSKDRDGFVSAKVSEAQARAAFDRARWFVQTVHSQQDALSLAQAELGLVAANDNVRQSELGKLRLILDIKRQFPAATQAEIDLLVAQQAELDKINAQIRDQKAAWDEVQQIGGHFIDTVLDPDNWKSGGDLIKMVLRDIGREMLVLAAINPLKNLLFGQNNPTLGGVLGSLFSVFGKGSSGFGSVAGAGSVFTTPGNASGNASFVGGLTWLHENGGEIADLPNGTRIYPAAESRRMMAGNDNQRGNTYVTVDAKDAVLAETVRGWIVEGMQIAATQGAAGGAQMSQADATARSSRQLGRRW